MTRISTLLLLGLLCSVLPGNAANFPTGFVAQLLADSLNPVGMALDDEGNIWLIEKHGAVRILDHHGGLLPDPFIQLNVDDYNERGLLGLALHPDFDLHPYVYLYYTVPGVNHNRVSRFRANGFLAVPGSEEILLDLDPLAGYVHNGGAMLFGPDSMLYIATGEAALPNLAQDLSSTHGKILRIEADGTIPTENPYYQQSTGTARAVWAYGLRNPFSIAIDPLSQAFYTVDVGAGAFEEIDELGIGKNYGWPQIEGPIDGQQAPSDYQDPIYAYDHSEGCAIVGAAFCRTPPGTFPDSFQGQFFFADYCDGYIKAYDPQNGIVTLFADQVNRPLAIAFDPEEGNMYFLTRAGLGGGSPADNSATQQGQLWQVSYSGDGSPFISVDPQSALVSLGEDARFHIQASGSAPLHYQWYNNGQALSNSDTSVLTLVSPGLADSGSLIHCIVSNTEGSDTSLAAVLSVTTNQRPDPVIDAPIAGSTFRAGDTLFFAGHALDPETGLIDSARLNWLIEWHHNEHSHPGAGPFVGTGQGYWVVPQVGETDTSVWYRVHLSAQDDAGLTHSAYVDIHPELSTVQLTGPSQVKVNIDGKIRALPYTVHSMIGLTRIIEALPTTEIGDQVYRFDRWSDGIVTPFRELKSSASPTSYELLYESFDLGNGTGLWGAYYNDSSLGFETVPVLERLEPRMSFLWGDFSPEAGVVHNNYFTARWTGDIQAIFDEVYTFYTRSDDGVRLWIGEELVIDKWIPQAPTQHSGDVYLEAGRRYPVRLEYFEQEGGAEMVWEWQSPSIHKSAIPSRQLYAQAQKIPGSISGEIWLDANENHFREIDEPPIQEVSVLLRQFSDSAVVERTESDSMGKYVFENVRPGTYFLQFLIQSSGRWLQPGKNMDLFGRTPEFVLKEKVHFALSAPFFEPKPQAFPSLQIYPVPVQHTLTIAFAQLLSDKVTLTLSDLQGKRWLEKSWRSQIGPNQSQFSLDVLPPGVYILHLHHSSGIETRKIVKW